MRHKSSCSNSEKNDLNRCTFTEVIAKIKLGYRFFGPPCSVATRLMCYGIADDDHRVIIIMGHIIMKIVSSSEIESYIKRKTVKS